LVDPKLLEADGCGGIQQIQRTSPPDVQLWPKLSGQKEAWAGKCCSQERPRGQRNRRSTRGREPGNYRSERGSPERIRRKQL